MFNQDERYASNNHKLEMKKESMLEKQMKAFKWHVIQEGLPVRC